MKLIEKTDAKYLRRLVRELNATPDGFYANAGNAYNERCNRARMNGASGRIECRSLRGAWFLPTNNDFNDAYGREICASRRV